MPSTTMLSPAAASAMPFCSALRKRGSSAMTWSEGKTPSTASGFSRSMRNAARPQAGAVLRATGSWTICSAGTPGNWSAISWARYSLVMIQVLSRLGQRLEALDGLLDHGALAVQRQNLLGVGAAGAGPEAGTAAAGENHRTKIDRASTWKTHPTRPALGLHSARRHILPAEGLLRVTARMTSSDLRQSGCRQGS